MSYEKGFIKFYNCFMENGEFKLSPREWYFYSLLASRWNPFLNVAETTISRISELQTVYKDKNRPTNDRVNTLKQISILQTKGAISISNFDELTVNGKTNYDKTLIISFKDYVKSESIDNSVYSRTTEPNELYFMCILQRFREKGYSHSMEQIATLFDCNIKTAERTILTMKEKKLIKYVQGEVFQGKDGQYSRKANTYFIRGLFEEDQPDTTDVEDDVVSNHLLPTTEESQTYLTMYGEVSLEFIERKIKFSNWGKKTTNSSGKTVSAKIVEDDINIMMTCEELGIELSNVKRWRNAINAMSKSFDMNDINSWIEQYGKMKERKIAALKKEKLDEQVADILENTNHVIVVNGEMIPVNSDNIQNYIDMINQNRDTIEICYDLTSGKTIRRMIYLAGMGDDIELMNDDVWSFIITRFVDFVQNNEIISNELLDSTRAEAKGKLNPS